MSFAGTQDRPDIGSSIFIVLTPTFNAVVVGFSHEDQLFKLPCGKVEHGDVPGPESAEFKALVATLYGGNTLTHLELVRAVASGARLDYRASTDNDESPEYAAFLTALARNCAVRELKAETGIREGELLHLAQLEYVRPIYKRTNFLRQFHFWGILRKQDQLGWNCEEGSEMGDPEYWDPVDVLKWEVPKNKKLNPYHRIALARCLIELRDGGVAEEIPDFAALLKRVEEAGFDLDTYESKIRELMKARDPQT